MKSEIIFCDQVQEMLLNRYYKWYVCFYFWRFLVFFSL